MHMCMTTDLSEMSSSWGGIQNVATDVEMSVSFDDIEFHNFLAQQDDLDLELDIDVLRTPPVKKKWIRDPSDPRNESFPSDVDFTAGGELVRSDRRNANKKYTARECLDARDRRRFAGNMAVDSMTVPTIDLYGNTVLNTDRIGDELLRTGTEARGLSTIVLSRASLAENVAFGMFEAHGTVLPGDMDAFAKVAYLVHLVGHVIPVLGQMRKPPSTGLGEKSKMYHNHRPITDEYHPFAFEPVILSTSGDAPGDSGEIVAQGIIVSNKGINFEVGDSRRVSFGRKSEFEESLCWVLVTHVYSSPSMTYASIGPPSTKKNGDAYGIVETSYKNLYDHVFRWTGFMRNNTHLRGCGVSLFGFTDTKQTGKDVTRRLFPWSIAHAVETLVWFRENDRLESFLREADMTSVKRASGRVDIPTGMDMRRFLLAELLLRGTPLENMLTNDRVYLQFAPPRIPGGGAGLYQRLHTYMFHNKQ